MTANSPTPEPTPMRNDRIPGRDTDFARKLHQMCSEEASRVMGDFDGRADMVTALILALTDTIAITTLGHKQASRELAGNAAVVIPRMVFDKAAMVRATLKEEAGRA